MTAIEMEGSSKKKLGTVLKLETRGIVSDQTPFVGHIILKTLVLDDEGNICLTSPMGLHGMLDAIDDLSKELDDLANQAVLRLASGITLRQARLAVIPIVEEDSKAGVSKGDGGYVGVSTPSPPHLKATNVISFPQQR